MMIMLGPEVSVLDFSVRIMLGCKIADYIYIYNSDT